MDKKLDFDIPKYKIFDYHRHVSTLNDFEDNLKEFNIGKFCLMPTMIENDFQNIHSFIEKVKPYHVKYEEQAVIFGALNFSKDAEENGTLLKQQLQELAIKGIKIHPEQGFKLEKNLLKPFFNVITEVLGHNIPMYVHMDWPLIEAKNFAPYSNKETFDKLASFFPDFKFIMGHAGGSGQYQDVWKTCKKLPNVYIETSMGPSTSPIEEVVQKIGPERVLFGSNYPYCSTSVELVKILCLHDVLDAEKKIILKSNWEVLFAK